MNSRRAPTPWLRLSDPGGHPPSREWRGRVDGPPPHLPAGCYCTASPPPPPSLVRIQPRAPSPARGRHVLNQPGREDPRRLPATPTPGGKIGRPAGAGNERTHHRHQTSGPPEKIGAEIFRKSLGQGLRVSKSPDEASNPCPPWGPTSSREGRLSGTGTCGRHDLSPRPKIP
jgi:hypothetical protein